MTRRQHIQIAILCALCGVLGYWAGVIVTTQEIVDHFGAEQAEQIIQPVSETLPFPRWRSA